MSETIYVLRDGSGERRVSVRSDATLHVAPDVWVMPENTIPAWDYPRDPVTRQGLVLLGGLTMAVMTVNLDVAETPVRAQQQINVHKWLWLLDAGFKSEKANTAAYNTNLELAEDRGLEVGGEINAAAAGLYKGYIADIYDFLTNTETSVTPAEFRAAWNALKDEVVF